MISNATITVNFFEIFINASYNLFDMCNKVFPSFYIWPIQNPSIFLSNVQWKAVNQLKTVISNATVTVNLFEIFINTSYNLFDMCHKVFPLNLHMANPKSINISLEQCTVEGCQSTERLSISEKQWFYSFFIMQLSLSTFLKF